MVETFGERLHRVRVARGYSIRALSEESKCAFGTIRGWERGSGDVVIDRLDAIATALSVSTHYMLCGETETALGEARKAFADWKAATCRALLDKRKSKADVLAMLVAA